MTENDNGHERTHTQYEHEMKIWHVRAQAEILGNIEMLKAVVAYSVLALKSLILVNGFGLVALLTFLGHVWASSKGEITQLSAASTMTNALSPSFKWFAAGLALGLFATGLSYIAQVLFSELPSNKAKKIWGNASRVLAMLTAFASLGALNLGMFGAMNAFGKIGLP